MATLTFDRSESVPRPMQQFLAPTEENWMNQAISTGVR